MRRLIVPLIFGLGGTAILIFLCLWQIQRLNWKEGVIAQIQAQLTQAPQALPRDPSPEQHNYMPVTFTATVTDTALHVLTSHGSGGPGYRVIAVVEADGRRIMLDRGYIPQPEKDSALATGPQQITGVLLWPRETDSFTPDPNLEQNIWFAREVDAMAAALQTEPLLVVAATPTGTPAPLALPVTINLPNNHLQYAITWGITALVWLAMTVLLVIRIRANPK